MKRIVKVVLCLLACLYFAGASARDYTQEYLDNKYESIYHGSIWVHAKKSISLGWVNQDFASEASSAIHSKYGFMLRSERTYLFPAKPISGIMKFGIDLNIPDLTVAKYEKESTNKIDDSVIGVNNFYLIDDSRMWTFNVGIGIGPSLTIAPLSDLSGYGRYIMGKIYFHYKPSASMLLVDGDGETEAEWAFCNMSDFGGKIMYRRISIGAEGHCGSGKFKAINFLSDDENAVSTDKIKYKFTSTRIYLSYNF